MQALSAHSPVGPNFSLVGVDIRAKLGICLLASVTTIVLSSFQAQATVFGCSLVYALSMRRLKPLVLAWLLCIVLMSTASVCMWGINHLFPSMPAFEPTTLAIPFLRMLTMMQVILPLALTSGVQPLLTLLKSLRLPFCIYIPAAVMVRFIPTFMADIRQVWETIRIRGYHTTPLGILRHPRLFLRLLFTPILFRALRSSEELGIAGELKGLGYARQFSPYKKLRWKHSDTLLLAVALLVVLLAATWEVSLGDAVSRRVMY